MWFEKLWNGALITGNSFATPRVGTGIMVVNADGASILNNTVATGTVKYSWLTFKAEEFIPARHPGMPYAEYVATSLSTIDDVLVQGNSVTDVYWGIRFGASTKPHDHGAPCAQDLTVSSPGVNICGNDFSNNTKDGVKIDADTQSESTSPCTGAWAHIYGEENIHINCNNFDGNTEAVDNGQDEVDAENNWWGDASGPTHVGNPGGSGDAVSDNVDYDPWVGAKMEEAKSETVTGSGTIDTTDTVTGVGDIDINAAGDHTVTTAKYESNPGGIPSFQATGNYYDVHLDDDTGVNSLTIEFCPAAPGTVIYYWDAAGSRWYACSQQIYQGGCIVVTITGATNPSLGDLTGLPFGGGVPFPPVGGQAYPANKLAILAPWIALAAAIIAGVTIAMRRRRAQG